VKKLQEQKKEGSLLKELCGEDTELYDYLANTLYENPTAGIAKEDLDTLSDEAEKSGKFGIVLDKAIFEASRNPEEREKYITLIRAFVSKSTSELEKEKEDAEEKGFTEKVASLEGKIKRQKIINERTEDTIKIASRFYEEKLANLNADIKRTEREKERMAAEREDKRINEQEKSEREARKKEIKGMKRQNRKEAKDQNRIKEKAAEERKEERERERMEAKKEDLRISEQEKSDRETRKKRELK